MVEYPANDSKFLAESFETHKPVTAEDSALVTDAFTARLTHHQTSGIDASRGDEPGSGAGIVIAAPVLSYVTLSMLITSPMLNVNVNLMKPYCRIPFALLTNPRYDA